MKRIVLLLSIVITFQISAQTDAENLKKIYDNTLTNGMAYQWLDHLSNQIGGRLSGSLNAEKAVQYTKEEFEKLGLDKVWLQPVMVPRWIRGAPEFAYIETSPGKTTSVNICALGGSVATPAGGIKANIIEVGTYKDLETLGEAKIKGKIVFINRPMQANLINTFEAYGG
ncbi:MAG: peptidase M28 family protein, partial [Psychroserpens sp.]